MRKFLAAFRKLFREILHFFGKINEAEMKQNFAKKILRTYFSEMRKFCENHSFIAAPINCSKEHFRVFCEETKCKNEAK